MKVEIKWLERTDGRVIRWSIVPVKDIPQKYKKRRREGVTAKETDRLNEVRRR